MTIFGISAKSGTPLAPFVVPAKAGTPLAEVNIPDFTEVTGHFDDTP